MLFLNWNFLFGYFSGSFFGASSGVKPEQEGGGVAQCGQNPEGR